ncbi:hypothetical protein PINS_up004917 [Pythium insidiosum]|nr:hypothetical protein PINS_up004917 [Pythium insidiosum]
MFVSVLPVAPMLALLGNVVFTRLDVICSTQVKRRPPFESETEVSTFMSILAFMSFAAVAVNCAVLFFTTRSDVETLLTLVIKAVWRQSGAALSSASPENYIARLWVLLFLEHTVLAIKAFVSLNLDDAAAWVQYDEGRQSKDAVTIQAHGERAQAALSQRLSERWDRGGDEELPRIASGEEGAGAGTDTGKGRGKCADATADASTVGEALSSYQRVLAEKCAAALQERNQALERENRLAQRLTECLREIEELKTKSQASKGRSIASAAIEADTDATDGSESGSESVLDSKAHAASPCSYRACVLCDLLSQTRLQTGVKRCLTCKRFFCDACDDLLHFDDLGVREDRHFRVSVPATATTTGITTALPSLADDSKTSRPATVPAALPHRRRSPDEQQELVEIERLFRSVVDGSKWERKLATWSDARQRVTLASAEDQALVLRYLRNAVRRHQRRTIDGGAGSGAVHPWETEEN